MASMVKEKRRGKKKTKEKYPNNPIESSVASTSSTIGAAKSEDITEKQIFENVTEKSTEQDITSIGAEQSTSSKELEKTEQNVAPLPITIIGNYNELISNVSPEILTAMESYKNLNVILERMAIPDQCSNTESVKLGIPKSQSGPETATESYKNLNARLEKMAILDQSSNTESIMLGIPKSQSGPEAEMESYKNLNARLERMSIPDQSQIESVIPDNQMLKPQSAQSTLEGVTPSAPMILEQTVPQAIPNEVIKDEKPKVVCMPLDEAIRLYGGTEMAAVMDMSEREEAEVEAGPNFAPEHPLIDLLSTFRSSLRAVERERSKLASNFDDEEKFRSTLWKVEKLKIHLTEQCKCGVSVDMKATYEYAQLMKEKLPVAKLKLEGLLKDVQESYCHHQHAAMLAHCQIEDLVSETIQGNKNWIRDTLSLILQSLRVSDGAPEALPAALQRWAEILASALFDERDLRQLFFVIHHLFRQTRSVLWAARVLHTQVNDSVSAARALAVLDTLLSKMHLESAVECVEETEEAWEEVDIRGGHGAVSSGTLRERDLIALVRALPLQQLISKLVLFSQSDFRQATEYDWGDASGGSGLLKSCCGVRVLISVLQHAVTVHGTYERLHGVLRDIACSALTALACLYWSPRAPYHKELEEKITAELQATFVAGFTLFGTQDLHRLPTMLLTEHTAKDYCLSFIVGLHEKSRKMINSLSIDAPVLPCSVRIRIITQATVDRERDHELARIVLDFLLQTGVVRKSMACKAGCEPTARECVPKLLTAHPYLRALALHTVADMSQVETLDPSTVSVLEVSKWRPNVEEMQAVLDDWSQRCPTLLQQLLLQLDYTPHTGIFLPVQLHIGSWLCAWSASSASRLEHAWRVLLLLRTHRVCWSVPCVAPPPDPEPTDLFSMAYAVLSSEWGHSIPLICSQGVNAIFTLCATRPREAVHCLAPIMLLMPQSPESVSLTPKFAELFTILLSCGPNLVQRALGRGGASGSELLLRLVLSQVDTKEPYVFTAWLHALWKVPAALSILDIAALAVRDWYVMDLYAATIIREENSKEYLTNAVRFAFTSPLLCESLLRAAHTNEVNTRLFPTLVAALSEQRRAGQRIHVDNALQKINPHMHSEELAIYRCANAALVAPFQHPSHLTLWRLLLHMYLERPHDRSSSIPCGPLFFSGIIKSRTISQIKKRLLENAIYHHNEAATYKKENNVSIQPRNRLSRSESVGIDNYQSLLPALTITDLTGEERKYSDDSDDSDGDRVSQNMVIGSTEEAIEMETKRNANMEAYHTGAEKMMRDYSRWLDDGEKVQSMPQHADIARYISPQALEEAWINTLSRCRPPPTPELDTFIRPEPIPPYTPEVAKTPLRTAIASILSVKCRSPVSESYRSRRTIRPCDDVLDDRAFNNIRQILSRVDELLKEIDKHAEEWDIEVNRISSQDSKLWELVSALRVPRPLPPVKKQCANNCKPITFYLNTQEWCISAGAERGIRDSRSASLAGIRRLTRARPQVVRAVAALFNIARRIRTADHAVKVLELAWRCAGQCKPCGVSHAALISLFDTLAERWITHDGQLCNKLLSKGCEYNSSTLQHTLCGSLVSPRNMKDGDWPDIYMTLLRCTLPPHTIFSFLSRFEMSRWKVKADPIQRQTILKALLQAAQRPPGPDQESEAVLLELVGVHTALLTTSQELVWLLQECAKISTLGGLPLSFWKHLNQAAEEQASGLTIDELGVILRNLGTTWSSVSSDSCERHATYALSTADLLCVLIQEFVRAAVKLTFEAMRVSSHVWPVLVVSWTPWVLPVSILPQPVCSSHYVTMLKRFTSCIRQIMRDCPGTENRLLLNIYAWTISTYENAHHLEPRPRVQLSAFLEQMAKLPWREHQWFNARGTMVASRIMGFEEKELVRWCCKRFLATKMETLMMGVDEEGLDMEEYLSNLLKMFVSNEYINDPDLLTEVSNLPWWDINDTAVKEGMQCFVKTHYKPTKPYHEMPQVLVILKAAEFHPLKFWSDFGHIKRGQLVSEWTSLHNNPALMAHSASYTKFMLDHITWLSPLLKNYKEIPNLLYRLAYMMQGNPTEVTPAVQGAWLKWLLSAPPNMIGPTVEMTSKLRMTEVTGPISDNAVRLYLQMFDDGWRAIRLLWRNLTVQPWQLMENRVLYAAYAATIADSSVLPVRSVTLLAKFQALLEVPNGIDYIKNEGIIAVWICYIVRIITDCDTEIAEQTTESTDAAKVKMPAATSATAATAATNTVRSGLSVSELEDCKRVALSVLATLGQQQWRSLLKVVTLQADTERPTARHRVMIRFADCINNPSPNSIKAYENAVNALSGSNPSEIITWGCFPTPWLLVRLAIKLHPNVPELYFKYELDMWPRS